MTEDQGMAKTRWRKVSIVMVVDKDGKILLTKRSRIKKFGPGKWEAGITETLEPGEDYETATIRGLEHELGLKVNSEDLIQIGDIGDYRFEHKDKQRCTIGTFYVYRLSKGDKIKKGEEIEKIKWCNSPDDLLEDFREDSRKPERRQRFFSASLEFLNQNSRAKKEVSELIVNRGSTFIMFITTKIV